MKNWKIKLNNLKKKITTMKINIFSENIYSETFLDINSEKKALKMAKKILQMYLKNKDIFDNSCLKNLEFDTISFDILYCDSNKTHEINKEYRKKDYPADIITFAVFADCEEKFIFDNEINLGEIIISLDKIKENSIEKKCTEQDELYFLIAHGILHLLGFDHQTMTDYNFMVENQIKTIDIIKNQKGVNL